MLASELHASAAAAADFFVPALPASTAGIDDNAVSATPPAAAGTSLDVPAPMTPKPKRQRREPPEHTHPLYSTTFAAPPPLPPPALLGLSPTCAAAKLAPGLVVLRGALSVEVQRWLASTAVGRGAEDPPRGFWSRAPGGGREPNSCVNAGRGRVYDALGRFAAAEALRAVCTALCSSSRAADASMPSMDPTHLLLVHYSGGKRVTPKIFWHKDDAPNDGANEHPVVSLSLGRSCLFRLAQGWSFRKHRELEQAGAIHDVQLHSGDCVVFGGASRYIHHTVQIVAPGTCPPHLAELLGDARLNLTFRDAPGVDAADYTSFRVGQGSGSARPAS